MISVEQAQTLCLSLVSTLDTESVPLIDAAGRVLANTAVAQRAQPPFDASAMDGYAVRSPDVYPGAELAVIGEASAGHIWQGQVGAGQAVRIFTGAPMPAGADRVIIQEDVSRHGDVIILGNRLENSFHVRKSGADFAEGFSLSPSRRLAPADLALLAAMNVSALTVTRSPRIAIIATGDELVMPGETPRVDQIIASNIFALRAMAISEGAVVDLLPIAKDTHEALRTSFERAMAADLIITVGGASVGDHDLVGAVARKLEMVPSFYKVAMRPGKPLMAGRLGKSAFIGLPGNPVSAIVCGHIFMLPVIRRLLGLKEVLPVTHRARLACDLDANGPRAHYMRARLTQIDGETWIAPAESQDSAMLRLLAQSNALLVRPAAQGPLTRGTSVNFLHL